jgi:putative ABC transport system substrate-binding protein
MSEATDYVQAGALILYAGNDLEVFRRAAVYVDKILKGAKLAELPVEQPTKFELVINLKTPKQIGLGIFRPMSWPEQIESSDDRPIHIENVC